MCGITGFVAISEQSKKLLNTVEDSTRTLHDTHGRRRNWIHFECPAGGKIELLHAHLVCDC